MLGFMKIFSTFVILVSCCKLTYCLDNGLVLTPPMGFLSWQTFGCNTDCKKYPDDCISERLFKAMADRMAQDGYLKAGYEYVIIDDCWMSPKRDENGRLQPDPERFPSGIKALADYIHGLGLKFGIYGDCGTHTCQGYPGSLNHEEIDTQTIAEWGVDYVKLDGCYINQNRMEEVYTKYGQYLNKTGRPIVYSCSWPAYVGIGANYDVLQKICNLWRNYGDIDNSWSSVKNIASWFAKNQKKLTKYAGPGHWNDPDMLIIGNKGLSYEQSKYQMAIWSILAAPLLLSADLRTIRPEFKDILTNLEAIKINQDKWGIQGILAENFKSQKIKVWTRQISPMLGNSTSYAIAIVSDRTDKIPYTIYVTFESIGLLHPYGYTIQDIFEPLPPIIVQKELVVAVHPTGAVLLRATPVQPNISI